ADLRGKKIAVIGPDGRNEALLRRILDLYDISASGVTIATESPDAPFDQLLSSGEYQVVIAFAPLSRISGDKRYGDLVKRLAGFSLGAVGEAKAIERRSQGIFAETLETGLFSAAPRIPDDELETVGVQWMLVARDKVSESSITELTRLIFENKASLAIND